MADIDGVVERVADDEGVLLGVAVGDIDGDGVMLGEADADGDDDVDDPGGSEPVCDEDAVPVTELEAVAVRDEDGVPVTDAVDAGVTDADGVPEGVGTGPGITMTPRKPVLVAAVARLVHELLASLYFRSWLALVLDDVA